MRRKEGKEERNVCAMVNRWFVKVKQACECLHILNLNSNETSYTYCTSRCAAHTSTQHTSYALTHATTRFETGNMVYTSAIFFFRLFQNFVSFYFISHTHAIPFNTHEQRMAQLSNRMRFLSIVVVVVAASVCEP